MSGIFASLFQAGPSVEQREWYSVYVEALNKNRENAGSGFVTPEGALALSAVYACVRVLSETMATIPLQMFERMQDGGRRRVTDHWLIQRLDDPNPFQTGFEFTETIIKHMALRGNAYIEISYDARGRITELFPLPPQRIIDHRFDGDQRLYLFQDVDGRTQWLNSSILWHIRLLGDGFTGYSPIGLTRRAAALGLSAEEFGQRFFENDARPGIVLEHPGQLSSQAHENLRNSWEERHKGVKRSHKPAILEEGMKLHEVGIPPEDAQFLETRKFQVNEIARIYRVPPHMIADLERSTNNNIEHQGIEFVKYTVLPWARRIEISAKKNLMVERDRLRYYLEYLVAGLERGDISSRYSAYAVGRQNGWLSANDIRQLENMNPIDGGDVYLVPLNMVPANQIGALDASPGGNPPDTARNILPPGRRNYPLEERQAQALNAARERHRLMNAHLRMYTDVAARVVRREANDVGGAAQKYLGKRDTADFLLWLEDFYREHADFIARNMRPLAFTYGELVAAAAQGEINVDQGLTDELEAFINRYVTAYGSRHSIRSLEQLKTIIKKALESEIEPLEAINEHLEHWRSVRPGRIAMEESVRFNNALAKTVYTIGGILKLRWMTFGENCPYCDSLDGRIVGIQENFINANEEYQPDGADRPLTVSHDVGHAPAHEGCDCMVVSG